MLIHEKIRDGSSCDVTGKGILLLRRDIALYTESFKRYAFEEDTTTEWVLLFYAIIASRS